MTDPKNIPLADAKPGDMVFLKPVTFVGHGNGYWLCESVPAFRQSFRASQIDHIERAPRVLKVGDRVQLGGRTGRLSGLDGDWAWVMLDSSGNSRLPCSCLLKDLEPAE